MIYIESDSPNQAWTSVFKNLYEQGLNTGNKKYMRDEVALIKITEPKVEPIDERFPMSQYDMDVINDFIHSGQNEDEVVHEWTKLYYHRMFDGPCSQIEYLINSLSEQWPDEASQVSIWDKEVDQAAEISPCTQIIWARIKHGRLELHIHANSSDAYKKLLMNLMEFISLQHYIAGRLNVKIGDYYHFLDSCHLHWKHKCDIEGLYATMK